MHAYELRQGLCRAFVSKGAPRFRTTTVHYASTLPTAARMQFLHDLAEHNLDALSQALLRLQRWLTARACSCERQACQSPQAALGVDWHTHCVCCPTRGALAQAGTPAV